MKELDNYNKKYPIKLPYGSKEELLKYFNEDLCNVFLEGILSPEEGIEKLNQLLNAFMEHYAYFENKQFEVKVSLNKHNQKHYQYPNIQIVVKDD